MKRNATRKVEVTVKDKKTGKKVKKNISYTRGEGVVLPDKNHPETWGLFVDPDTGKTRKNKKYSKNYKTAHAWYESSRGSGGQKLTTEDQIDEMDRGGIVTDAHSDRKANAAVNGAIDKQTTRKTTAGKEKREILLMIRKQLTKPHLLQIQILLMIRSFIKEKIYIWKYLVKPRY